ncbi:hypothetical protein HW555_009968, partial [Spodoptera exigua]
LYFPGTPWRRNQSPLPTKCIQLYRELLTWCPFGCATNLAARPTRTRAQNVSGCAATLVAPPLFTIALYGVSLTRPPGRRPVAPPHYSDRDLKKKCWEEVVDLFGEQEQTVEEKKSLVATNMPNRKVVIAGAAFIFMYLLTEDRKSRKRRWWKTNLYKRRSSLLVELKSQHISGQYKNFTRMSPTDFEYLLTIIAPKISRQDTIMRSAISPQDRLALTLRFLATGDSFTSLQYTFRISKQSMSCIVPEVCEAIIKALKENIKTIVMAIAHLHNFLRNTDSSKNLYAPPGSLDSDQNGRLCEGSWRRDCEMSSLLPLNNVPRRAASTAKQIRDEFNDYFMNESKETSSMQLPLCCVVSLDYFDLLKMPAPLLRVFWIPNNRFFLIQTNKFKRLFVTPHHERTYDTTVTNAVQTSTASVFVFARKTDSRWINPERRASVTYFHVQVIKIEKNGFDLFKTIAVKRLGYHPIIVTYVRCIFVRMISITAETKANLITTCLQKYFDAGVTVVSMTFDGCPANLSAAEILGCKLTNPKNLVTHFPHPSTQEKIVCVNLVVHFVRFVPKTASSRLNLTPN